MTLVRINPWSGVRSLQGTLDRFFTDFDRPLTRSDGNVAERSWNPSVDVFETAEELVFTAEFPGFEKDDLSISVDDGLLTIATEREFKEDDSRDYLRVERRYGRFERSFRLPTTVDPDRISANLKNGILTVVLPKKEEARPRQIPVSVN